MSSKLLSIGAIGMPVHVLIDDWRRNGGEHTRTLCSVPPVRER
ncbi:hypothetical protein [Denitratisoma oestradiolicum]|uniref:Uncharacterized protein n=1 Tax=Denitratisoma oestradiolicum TaxID=311182 RepID=A0A6S6XR30_9PROT|nr:hypothetical protein [Denitratisoma oestradiolicum]CAB1368391.1 protein of unknown function [Denitratisoma oestradiolicum]